MRFSCDYNVDSLAKFNYIRVFHKSGVSILQKIYCEKLRLLTDFGKRNLLKIWCRAGKNWTCTWVNFKAKHVIGEKRWANPIILLKRLKRWKCWKSTVMLWFSYALSLSIISAPCKCLFCETNLKREREMEKEERRDIWIKRGNDTCNVFCARS